MTCFRILGPVEAVEGERRLAVGGRRQLALLAFLLLHANKAVSSDAVTDAIWGPARNGADNRLPMAIARLRRALEPLNRNGEPLLRTVGGCYVLSVAPGELDAEAFATGVQQGRRALEASEAARAAELLSGALGLWRGPPLAEVAFEDFAQPEIRRLEELRLVAIEARVDADLQLGRQAELTGELEALVAGQPTRERLAAQLMLALYRCGRQADALQVYQQARTHLAEELGLEPGPALKTLQAQILEQAPSLEAAIATPADGHGAPEEPTPPTFIAPAPPASTAVESVAVAERDHRKTVTVLFVDIVDSTALGSRLDPEALRALMRRYYAVVRAAIEGHGGSLQKFIGDAVVAVFGVPAVHEDDALRAIRAGLQARKRLADLNAELDSELGVRIEIRTGINTGEVVIGDRADGEEVVVGDVLNVAARLEQGAAEAETLVGETTYAIVRHAVRAERVDLEVKGKAEPLVAYRLLGVVEGADGQRRRHRSPLVGRAPELRLFEEAYRRAGREGACHLFTVLGPAGVGKSRLVAEAAAASEGATVVAGRCLPYGEGITFWPLAEILRGAAGVREGDSGEDVQQMLAALLEADEGGERAATIAAVLAGVIGASEGSAQIEELFWATRRLFEVLAQRGPLVVVFEDLHWAEPTLLDLIEHIAEMSRGAAILIVCVARPQLLDSRPAWGGGKRNATSIYLEPLTPGESAQLIENLLPGGSLPAEVSARITAGSEGFPLYVEEMIAMLGEQGMLERDGLGWMEIASVEVPPTIRALLAARLDGLPVDERGVLELASVVGREFWQAAIAAIAPAEITERSRDVLGALVRKDLIVPERSTVTGEDSFRFRHILIRDAAYDSLPKADRADLHERFASWLQHSFAGRLAEVEEIVGYHLERAHTYRATLGQVRADLAERAAAHLGAAGRRALDARAAIGLLERARSLSPAGSAAHRKFGLDVGVALWRAGDFERARAVVQDVKEEASAAGDSVTLAHARLDHAWIRFPVDPEGAAANARLEADAAMPVFQRAQDHLGIAKALILASAPDHMQCRYAPLRRSYEQALVHLRTAGDRHWALWVLDLIAIAVTNGPTPIPEAIARMGEIVRDAGASPEMCARVQVLTGYLQALQGLEREALDAEVQAEAIARDVGAEQDLAWFAQDAGPLLQLLGRLNQAEQLLREGEKICERRGERNWRSTLLAVLAQVLFDQGRVDEAGEAARQAIEIGASDDYQTMAHAHAALASVLATYGDPKAEPVARRAVELAEQTDMLVTQGEAWEILATLLLAQGREAEANEALREALDRFERKCATASADRVRAQLR